MIKKNTSTLQWAHPLIQEWFSQKIGVPTEPQFLGWPSILANKDTLISAPTGSGKTLAAFLICLNQLVCKAINNELTHTTEVLYISPLKALGNDVQKNLMKPLHEIKMLAKSKDIYMQDIIVSVRTGDTPTSERQKMVKKPPHILVTTPESLFILLTSEKSQNNLTQIHTVIVDEIHALLNDKRGAHLALSLARLDAISQILPIRIGLSATQKPLSVVAQFLTGYHRSPANIIPIGHEKHLELAIEVPQKKLEAVASNLLWDEIYDRLSQLATQNRSMLVFANTRRIAERTAHHLNERMSPGSVLAHHGSLSKKLRLEAETQLKNGELKVLVATASMELGIDIGHVDLVCQLGSPRSIAVMLQRVGRSGHWHGAISKGKIFPTTRDELLECAALVNAIYQSDLDTPVIPREPLDILAQQIVATCATKDYLADDLYQLFTGVFHYHQLSRETFDSILEMLSQGIGGARGRYGAYLHYDKTTGILKGRRGSRMIAIMNGGAIPENALFNVIIEGSNTIIGTLDEDFAVESNRGDIFLLGSTSWKVKQVEGRSGRVIVENAQGAAPSVPFWRGEAPERTAELSHWVSHLRQIIAEKSFNLSKKYLMKTCYLTEFAAEQLVQYIQESKAILGKIPTQQTLIAERFFDESGGMQLIIHAPFGARINKAWGLALRKCFCRSFDIELQASATDNGIHIALTQQHSFPLADVFKFLNTQTITKILTKALLQSPIFLTRWRWDAGRALVLTRYRGGKKIPPHILRMIGDDLLGAVFPQAIACQDNLGGVDIVLPDHPLVNETIKDCFMEALNLEGLIAILNKIQHHQIECITIDTPIPSPLAHEIFNANPFAYLDDAPLEERRARAVEMRQILPLELLKQIGKLDRNAIEEVQQQAWPDVQNNEELYDFLQTVKLFPIGVFSQFATEWQSLFEELKAKSRVIEKTYHSLLFWITIENEDNCSTLYHSAFNENNESFILNMIQGWMGYLGPVTAQDLSQWLLLPVSAVEQALLKIEISGQILRGIFKSDEQEWCERRLLARIHRLTVHHLRQEIAPSSKTHFLEWLAYWQHVSLDSQLTGETGIQQIIEQFQGYEMPAKMWEDRIFKTRIQSYSPDLLDKLCITGVVGWGRFSCRGQSLKRVIPTSVAPITFFIRKQSQWLAHLEKNENNSQLSGVARLVYDFLHQFGAAFITDIIEGIGHIKAEVELALWELVTAGLATADSFDNLRALITQKRRLRKKNYRGYYNNGRWSLLKISPQKTSGIEAWCQLLLKRYGIVFREMISREKLAPRWYELLVEFRRLELRGEIRGGRFVENIRGEQFALPIAVDSLRNFKFPEKLLTWSNQLAEYDPLKTLSVILEPKSENC